jgi:phage pi2 protein 07
MVKNSFSENGGVLHYTYEYARTIMDIQSMQFFHQTFFTDNYEGDRDRKAGIGQHKN